MLLTLSPPAISDLVTPRLEQFLDWFNYKSAATLPADPPFVPLALVLIALALQAIRTTASSESQHLQATASATNSAGDLPVEPGVSTERVLLEIAGRCIDGLQVACPSAWASAYQAPIDLVKAALLRGLWHLNEQHMSFAGTCFGTATRLAFAAGLNRDPKHWPTMTREEGQARRNLWWNVVFFEVMHASRNNNIPSSIQPATFDVDLPTDYEALRQIYANAIHFQAQARHNLAHAQSGNAASSASSSSSNNTARMMREYRQPYANRAKGLAALFMLAKVQLQQDVQMARAHRQPSQSLVKTMSAAWDSFRAEMPAAIRESFERNTRQREREAREHAVLRDEAVGAEEGGDRHGEAGANGQGGGGHHLALVNFDLNEDQRTDWLQRSMLQLIFWHGQMTIHRPYADEEWKREAKGNLEKCLVAA